MNFFPTPYDDEILYSVLSRYAIRSGNLKEIHTIEDLFSTKSNISALELPSKIDVLISNMPVYSTYTSKYLINRHTLFPYYAAFSPPDRAEQVVNAMLNGNSSTCYLKLGFTSGFIKLNKYLRFCPKCFKEDIDIYGESYFRSVHQITGVFVCPKHMVPIFNSKVLTRGGNRQRFIAADKNNCIIDEDIYYSVNMMKKMMWMANDADELLQCNFNFKEQVWFKSQFREKLIEKGYAHMNNFVHQKKLRQDFVEFYGEEYLKLVQSPIENNSKNWLTDMINKNNYTTFTLRYLLLTKFLEIPLDILFNQKIGLNSNSKNEENNIVAYQKLWDERMIELISLNISIREIASILDTTPSTVRKRIDKLSIEPFWKNNGGGKYIHKKYTETDEFKNRRDSSRKLWIELLHKNQDKSSNQIKQKNQAIYRWLSKYDIEWLRQNARISNSKHNNVDWNQRDAEIIERAKQVVVEMKEGKPERITWTTIGSKIGISGWLYKKKEKLPLTKEFIEFAIENLDEFHIRKIIWGINLLEMEGKHITKWNLIETAGVKIRYIKTISSDVEKILIEKGYDCDFFK